MPQARPFNAVPPFGPGALTRVNVTTAQAASYVNILSLADAAKLYWNLNQLSLTYGAAGLISSVGYSSPESSVSPAAANQPDERICTPIEVTASDGTSSGQSGTSVAAQFALRPSEVYNTDTEQVIGYTLPWTFDAGSAIPGTPSGFAEGSVILRGNAEVTDFLSGGFLVVYAYLRLTTGPNPGDEDTITMFGNRYFRKVDALPITLLGVSLNVLVYRIAEYPPSGYPDMVIDLSDRASSGEYSITADNTASSDPFARDIVYATAFPNGSSAGLTGIIGSEAWTYG